MSQETEIYIKLSQEEIQFINEAGTSIYKVDDVWTWDHQNIFFFRMKKGLNKIHCILRQKMSGGDVYEISLEYDREYYDSIAKGDSRILTWTNLEKIDVR